MARFIGKDSLKKRVQKLKATRKGMMADVGNLHVVLQKGNRKTGANCYTVSLLPIVDCNNCSECMWDCYDAKTDMIYPRVVADRSKNSAIHKTDPERYWNEISLQIKANNVKELRLNVGGDLTDDDFAYIKKVGEENPDTLILFFTKNYNGINKFLDGDKFPDNVKPIMSTWENVKMDNPHQLPQSHVLYEDGRTTAPEYGAVYCGGNCSDCVIKGEGCWNLKCGEHVIFKVH